MHPHNSADGICLWPTADDHAAFPAAGATLAPTALRRGSSPDGVKEESSLEQNRFWGRREGCRSNGLAVNNPAPPESRSLLLNDASVLPPRVTSQRLRTDLEAETHPGGDAPPQA